MRYAKNLVFGLTAQQQLTQDIFSLSAPVLSSFGTHACTNVSNREQTHHKSLSASHHLGVFFYEQLIKELQKESGDGISTSVLILNKILKQGLLSLQEGKKPQILQKELQEGAQIITSLLYQSSQIIDSIEKLRCVSHTATSQDEEATDLVCNIVGQIHHNDPILIEKSPEISSFIEINAGIYLKQGCAQALFSSEKARLRQCLENPYTLVTNLNITAFQDILHIIEKLPEKKLLIICENISSQVLSLLIINKLKGLIDVAVTKTLKNPEITEETLQNITLLTGGRVFSKHNKDSLKHCSLDDLGRCSRVDLSPHSTIIINNKISSSSFNHCLSLPNEKNFNHIGTVFLSASKKTEFFNKQCKVLSSIKSTQTALKKGMILGGGVGLYHIANKILAERPSINAGTLILCQACFSPLKKILANNVHKTSYKTLLKKITSCKFQNTGFNKNTRALDNFLQIGIFDSTQIIINSILKATQIACEIFSCDVVIENTNIY